MCRLGLCYSEPAAAAPGGRISHTNYLKNCPPALRQGACSHSRARQAKAARRMSQNWLDQNTQMATHAFLGAAS